MPTAEVIQSPRIPHHALAGDPRAKAVIVGVHGKKGEKEIAGHGRIPFLESEVVDVDEIGRTERRHVGITLAQPKPFRGPRQPGQDLSDAPCHRFVGDLERHAYEADARTETLCQIVRIDEFSGRRILDVAKAQETWIKPLR